MSFSHVEHTWQETGISQWKTFHKTTSRDMIAANSSAGQCFDSCSQRRGLVRMVHHLPVLLMEYQR